MRATSTRLVGALVLAALVGAGCGGETGATDNSAATGPTTAATTETTETSTTSSEPATDSSAATTGSTTTTAVATTIVDTADPGTVIVAADTGVWATTYEGPSSQLIAWSSPIEFPADAIDFAIGDTRGGLIVQPDRSPFFYAGADAIAYWIPQGAGALQQLLVPAPDQGLVLEDVVAQDDGVGVYYTRTEGSLPDDARQTLRRFDLDAKTVEEVAVVGGWESGASRISVGGDRIALNWGAEGFIGIEVLDLAGVVVESPANPLADGEFDCYPDCAWAATLSPDGTRLAYSTVVAGVTTITIAEVADGSTVMTFTLPTDGPWQVESLDLGDDFLVVNRIEEGSEWNGSAYLVDLDSGGREFWEVPHNGIARLTDTLPRLDGVISWP